MKALTVVSVQTASAPEPVHVPAKLKSWLPPPVVSAATDPTDAAISISKPTATLAIRLMQRPSIPVGSGSPLARHGLGDQGRRTVRQRFSIGSRL
ncbi:MAG: hypothetical protein ABIP77_07810 [Candidatus Limnocylindrales bacterium]